MTHLPPILARDYLRHAIFFPAKAIAAYLAAVAAFGIIGAVTLGVL